MQANYHIAAKKFTQAGQKVNIDSIFIIFLLKLTNLSSN